MPDVLSCRPRRSSVGRRDDTPIRCIVEPLRDVHGAVRRHVGRAEIVDVVVSRDRSAGGGAIDERLVDRSEEIGACEYEISAGGVGAVDHFAEIFRRIHGSNITSRLRDALAEGTVCVGGRGRGCAGPDIGLYEAVLVVVGVEGGGADLGDVAVVVVCEGGSGNNAGIGFKSSDREVIGRPICRGTFAPA